LRTKIHLNKLNPVLDIDQTDFHRSEPSSRNL